MAGSISSFSTVLLFFVLSICCYGLDPPQARTVYAVADIGLRPSVISPRTGKELLYGHSFIHIEGTATDGAVRIEHIQPQQWQFAIRLLDYGVANNDKQSLGPKSTAKTLRKIWKVGTTTMTNAQFADAQSGKGMLLDVWQRNPVWVQGTNCCNQYVQNMLKAMKLKVPAGFNQYVANTVEYAKLRLFAVEKTDLPLVLETITKWNDNSGTLKTEFDTTDLTNPKIIPTEIPEDDAILADTSVPSQDILKEPLRSPWDNVKLPSPFENVPAFDDTPQGSGTTASEPEEGGTPNTEPDGAVAEGASNAAIDGTAVDSTQLAKTVSTVRVGGVISDVVVVAETAAKAAGIVGLAAAPVFIILDFVNGNPVGGAFGAVGLALGVLAATALEGPVGWLVGGLAAFFSILPTFFGSSAPTLPRSNNSTEIIQSAMFGDPSHTGNEKCREQNPNCTAVYGPGVLSLAFKWDNFDPTVFLLQYNAGYAMTIPDIASKFYITDPSKPNDGADKIATITCTPKRAVCNRFNCPGPDKTHCSNPTFKLNRPLVTIPVLNQTADKIYNRIIPKPHGDCKIVSDVSGIKYDDYNVTVHGFPAAIACGVTPSLNIDGAVSLINDTNANNNLSASLIAPANQSTDGSVHEVAAPAPSPFLPLNSTDAVCLSGRSGNMCFPNGTYDIQKGQFGFDSSQIDTLTLPQGGSLQFTVPTFNKPHQPTTLVPKTYSTNQTSNDKDFSRYFNEIVAVAVGPRTFTVSLPDTPASACLYSQPKYKGDVICYGVGGGNLSSNVVNGPQSISFHGGASAWIYANYYGDDGAQRITLDTPDLSSVPNGADENFSQKMKAIWVIGG